MSKTTKLLETLEAEMGRFVEEVRAAAEGAAQVRELVAGLRQASDRWQKLESRIKGALEELEQIQEDVKSELEVLEDFKKSALSNVNAALEDLHRELREAIGAEKEKLAEIQNVVFKELQDQRDYLKTRLGEHGEKIEEANSRMLRVATKSEVALQRAGTASALSKGALVLSVLALGVLGWVWVRGAGGALVP